MRNHHFYSRKRNKKGVATLYRKTGWFVVYRGEKTPGALCLPGLGGKLFTHKRTMHTYLEGFTTLFDELVLNASLSRDRNLVHDLLPTLTGEALSQGPGGFDLLRAIIGKQPPMPLEFSLSFTQQGQDNLGYRLAAPANSDWEWLAAHTSTIKRLLEKISAASLFPLHTALMAGLRGTRPQGAAQLGVFHRSGLAPMLQIDYPLTGQGDQLEENLLYVSDVLRDYLGDLNIFCLNRDLPGFDPVALRLEYSTSAPRLVCISQSQQAFSLTELKDWLQRVDLGQSYTLLSGFYHLLCGQETERINPPITLSIGQNAGNVRPTLGMSFPLNQFVHCDQLAVSRISSLLYRMGYDGGIYSRATQLISGGELEGRNLRIHSQAGIHSNGYTAAVQVGFQPTWERLRSVARQAPFTAAGVSI